MAENKVSVETVTAYEAGFESGYPGSPMITV